MESETKNYGEKLYFEPIAPPKTVIDKLTDETRTIKFRFRCKEDAEMFMAKTGLCLIVGKLNKVNYPFVNLAEFFE